MKIYGLIGKPLDHSRSAWYFEEKFRQEHLADCAYRNFPLEEIADLAKLVHTNQHLWGLNVTAPYKRSVIPCLDRLNLNAQQIGAVNCIKINRYNNRTELEGFNTDYLAFFQTLLPLIPSGIENALVLGTGGASAAVCFALQMAGINPTVVSRKIREGSIGYERLDLSLIRGHRLIVNATPVGTAGYQDGVPDLPYEMLTAHHILYDLVYNPPETEFLKRARSMGARVINGQEMLNLQAELSWQIWNS